MKYTKGQMGMISFFLFYLSLATTCIQDPCEEITPHPIRANLSDNMISSNAIVNDYGVYSTQDSLFKYTGYALLVEIEYKKPNDSNLFECMRKISIDTITSIEIYDSFSFNNNYTQNTSINRAFEIYDRESNLRYSIDDYISKFQFFSSRERTKQIVLRPIENPSFFKPHKFKVRLKYSQKEITSSNPIIQFQL